MLADCLFLRDVVSKDSLSSGFYSIFGVSCYGGAEWKVVFVSGRRVEGDVCLVCWWYVCVGMAQVVGGLASCKPNYAFDIPCMHGDGGCLYQRTVLL